MLVASTGAPAGALCVVQLLLRLHRLLSTSQYLLASSLAALSHCRHRRQRRTGRDPPIFDLQGSYDTIRDAILTCSRKTVISQLNLPHGTDN